MTAATSTSWDRQWVVELLAECGRLAMRLYENPDISVKSDRSLVTEADRQIESLLAASLDRPEEGSYLIGEETIASRGEAYITAALNRTAWVVDPIDGTAAYAHHIPTWGISIALLSQGTVREGAVMLPATGELFLSEKGRVWWGPAAATPEGTLSLLRDLASLPRGEAAFDETRPVGIGQGMAKRGRVELANPVQAVGSAVFSLVYLCLGRYEGYIARLKLWDFAGTLPLLLGCGLPVELASGRAVSARVEEETWILDPGDPDRWKTRGLLIAGRTQESVRRLRSLIR